MRFNELFRKQQHQAALTDLVRSPSERVVAFIGSGLSASAGYWRWWQLVQELQTACKISPPQEITEDTPSVVLQEVAEQALTSKRDIYISLITQHFGKLIRSTPRTYQQLMRAPFQCFVTTNFDPLLFQAAAAQNSPPAAPVTVHAYPDRLDPTYLTHRNHIFYLHGYVPEESHDEINPARVVLPKSVFDAAYRCDSPLRDFWRILLGNCHLLFLGCRLGEPELLTLFNECKQRHLAWQENYGVEAKKRFILLEDDFMTFRSASEEEKQTAKFAALKGYEDLGILPVLYDKRNEHFDGLVEVLQEWTPERSQLSFPSEEVSAI